MTASPEAPHIGLVVEGPGDKQGVPILLRTHLSRGGEYRDVFGKPIPCKGRGSATAANGIEGFVGTAAARPGCRGVLVVLDGEGDPVCTVGPQLAERARSVSKVPVEVCLADRHFEEWIYCSAETLDLGLEYGAGASAIMAIKSGLNPIKYTKTVWQPRLAARMDPVLAAGRSVSLSRMFRKIDELVRLIP